MPSRKKICGMVHQADSKIDSDTCEEYVGMAWKKIETKAQCEPFELDTLVPKVIVVETTVVV